MLENHWAMDFSLSKGIGHPAEWNQDFIHSWGYGIFGHHCLWNQQCHNGYMILTSTYYEEEGVLGGGRWCNDESDRSTSLFCWPGTKRYWIFFHSFWIWFIFLVLIELYSPISIEFEFRGPVSPFDCQNRNKKERKLPYSFVFIIEGVHINLHALWKIIWKTTN